MQAKKLSPLDAGLSPDDIRAAYPEFTTLLQKRMDEILSRENSTRANLDEQIQTSPGDEADTSVLDTSADYFLKLSNNHQREIIQIRAALDRMHRGIFGVCENCGDPISIERLRRLPIARNCIDCQSAVERGSAIPFPRSRPKL